MKVYTAPDPLLNITNYKNRIFLAGSIENGAAEEWQLEVIERIETSGLIMTETCFINPRRPKWPKDEEQSYYNTVLNHQISWELKGLEISTKVLMYLQPNTLSRISVLELGAFKHKCIVVCPDGFDRKANIDVFCERYMIPLYTTLEEALNIVV